MKRQFLLSIFLFLAFITLVCALPCRGQNSGWTKEYPISYIQETEIEVTSTSQAIASLSNRLFLNIESIGQEMWISVGTTTAVVGQGRLLSEDAQFMATIGDSVPVGIIASVTASATVDQGY